MANQNIQFQKLTPTKELKLDIYEDALNFVFKNNDIRNVAITGPYGAGKTSLIETYKEKHKDKNCINISLAHFKSENNENNIDENMLEGKILNQLIHQIDAKKIPKTNFKVKQKVSRKKLAINTVVLILFLVLILYMTFFDSWNNYISWLSSEKLKKSLQWTTKQELLLLSGLLSFLIFGKVIYSLILAQNNRNIFKKFNLQGNEIEIFEESQESYFDKYLNEVLYIFGNSDADAIIFEDIDRYNVSQIFGKLREINTLVNNKRIRKNDEPIRFIFLLRDDVFISKDRTKFFDFIIPIIPVVDGSNSYEQFLEHFKNGNLSDIFDAKFLQGLSLYIDDMRILKNIYNEFLIYKNRLSSIELNPNKLLALITYKNIFPKDFSDLQLSSGYIYTLFSKKNEFVEEKISLFESKITDKEHLLEEIEKEILQSVEELDAVYLTSRYTFHTVNGKNIELFSSVKEILKELKKYPNKNQVLQNGQWRTINFQDEFEKLNEIPEYLERKKLIEYKKSSTLEKLNKEVKDLRREKSEIKNWKLSRIINKENINTIFKVTYTNEIGEETNFEDIKSSSYYPLIKYLIRNGYIDETYSDYMTYFYENNLSINDKIFLRSVSDQAAKDYTYPLNNPELVVTRLNLLDFKNEEILNFELLRFLLNKRDEYTVFLYEFIEQLKVTNNFNFIKEFLELDMEIEVFIKAINYKWVSIFEDIIDNSDFNDSQKKQYAINLLYYSSDNELAELNNKGYLTEFISNNPSFLNINNPILEKVIEGFIKLNIQFKEINYEETNKDLFEAVYMNHLYELNYELIELILEKKYRLHRNNDYRIKNYSLIRSDTQQSLYLYVNDNIKSYFEILLSNCDEIILDDEEAALELINNSNVDYNDKVQYLEYLQTEIIDINDIDDVKLWDKILEYRLVQYNVENILSYYVTYEHETGEEVDPILIDFINSSNLPLEFNENIVNEFYGEGEDGKLFVSLIRCNNLSNERYESILPTFKLFFNLFTHTEINSEKIKILIDKNIIRMTGDNLQFIRENYEELIIYFNLKNIKEYLQLIESDNENYSSSETMKLLEEPIDDTDKINLLKYTDEQISIIDKDYSKIILKHILNNHFDFSDMQYLAVNYFKQDAEVRRIIEKLIIDQIENVIDQEIQLPYVLLKEVLNSEDARSEYKKWVFANSLMLYNLEQTIELIENLGLNEYKGLFNLKRPKILISDIDTRILTVFKEKGWVTNFIEDPEYTGYYRAYGRNLIEV